MILRTITTTSLLLLLLCAANLPLSGEPMSFDQYLCRITPPAGWQRADVGNPPVGVSLLAVRSPSGKSRLALVVLPIQRTFTLDDPTFVESLRESIMGKLHGVSCTFGELAGVKSLQCKGALPQDPAMKMTMTAAVANGYGYVLTAVGPETEIATPEAAGFFNSFSFIGPPAEHQSDGTDAAGRPLATESDSPLGTAFLKYFLPLLAVVVLTYVISVGCGRYEERKQQQG